MYRSNEESSVSENRDTLALPRLEDSEVKQNRRLAVMASLAEGLPTLPAYVFELDSLLGDTPVNLRQVGEVIRTDPSLSAQVIRMCNSALLGCREKVKTIKHAVILLGTERLRMLVLTCSLVESMGDRLASEDVQSYWQHCFLTAALSERLARAIAYPQPEHAYLAGLLHDIGALPLLMIDSSASTRTGDSASPALGESVTEEQERYGTDHCEVGRWIGTSWNFPPNLLEVMEKHHTPREGSHDVVLVGIVAAADRFCLRRRLVLGAEPTNGPTLNPNQEILRACLPHLRPAQVEKLGEVLEADFLHFIQLLEFGAAGLFGGAIPKNPFH